jgi:leucyl-tRNA synthetase
MYDLGHVHTREPFARLFGIGHIGAYAYTDERGFYVPAAEIEERDGEFLYQNKQVTREYGKMGKSLKNAVDPLEIIDEFGADTLRLYLMSVGPLDKAKPWESRNIIGIVRFLQRVWRNLIDENTGKCVVEDVACDDETKRLVHLTIDKVRVDYDQLGLNTAIARMIELNNHLTGLATVPREAAEALVLMLAPIAPHISEELWRRLGHNTSLHRAAFPVADMSLLAAATVVVPVQIKGKKRGLIELPADADETAMRNAAMQLEAVVAALGGNAPRQVIVVPGRLVNIVP